MRRIPALVLLLWCVTVVTASCGGGGTDGSDGGGAEPPASTTTTIKPTYDDLDPTEITLNPVLEIVACDGAGIPGESTATTEAVSNDTVPAVDGDLCYVLGPAGGDGTDLRDAKVYADGVGIEVAVREGSVDALNAMFDACYQATDTCPASSSEGRGYVAVVVDGRVISTPAINEELLASTPFVIAGNFDESQASNIATSINGY